MAGLPTFADFTDRLGKYQGLDVLRALLASTPWRTPAQALASLAVFAHPDAVRAVGSRAVFRNVRGPKGEFLDGRVMGDDSAGPQTAFCWATGLRRGADTQCNHIYARSDDPEAYTDLRNICVTPTFLAKLTDSQAEDPGADHACRVLRYRAFELHGYEGPDGVRPAKPDGYDALVWADPLGRGATPAGIEALFRKGLSRRRTDRLNKSARFLGWTFSDFEPDESIVYEGRDIPEMPGPSLG